jgi:hypothetical protein
VPIPKIINVKVRLAVMLMVLRTKVYKTSLLNVSLVTENCPNLFYSHAGLVKTREIKTCKPLYRNAAVDKAVVCSNWMSARDFVDDSICDYF